MATNDEDGTGEGKIYRRSFQDLTETQRFGMSTAWLVGWLAVLQTDLAMSEYCYPVKSFLLPLLRSTADVSLDACCLCLAYRPRGARMLPLLVVLPSGQLCTLIGHGQVLPFEFFQRSIRPFMYMTRRTIIKTRLLLQLLFFCCCYCWCFTVLY